VGEKTARERLTDDESNHGVTSESGGAVSVRGCRGGQIDGGGLLAPGRRPGS
jgi:hypothetical protein